MEGGRDEGDKKRNRKNSSGQAQYKKPKRKILKLTHTQDKRQG